MLQRLHISADKIMKANALSRFSTVCVLSSGITNLKFTRRHCVVSMLHTAKKLPSEDSQPYEPEMHLPSVEDA